MSPVLQAAQKSRYCQTGCKKGGTRTWHNSSASPLTKPLPHQEPAWCRDNCSVPLPFPSQSLVPVFLNSFTPQHTSVAPALRSRRNLPNLQHPCLSTSLHTRVSCRAQNGECRTQALSNEQLEAPMMRDQEWSKNGAGTKSNNLQAKAEGKSCSYSLDSC